MANKKNEDHKKKQVEEENEEENEEEEEEEDEEEGDLLGDYPLNVKRRVLALRALHTELEAIEEEYKKERIELEKKFNAKKQAYYEKRQPIVSGEVEVPKADDEEEEGEETDEKGVSDFWLTALSAHPNIGELITEDDMAALAALSNITVEYSDDFTAFTLHFHFKENEFFSNAVLTKKYTVSPDLLDEKNPNLSEIDSTPIQWKDGKNLCVTEIKKKQKAKSGRNKGQVRTVTRTVPKPSFFHYFDEHKEDDVEEEEEQPEEEEGDGLGRTKLSVEEDYDIGHIIRTSVIPEAVLFVTGEADIGFDMDDDDEDFEDGEEDDDDEEGDEDEDDDEDDAPKGKKGGKGGKAAFNAGGFAAAPGAAGAAAGQNPECKQN